MKKIITIIVSVIMCFACLAMVTSCDSKDKDEKTKINKEAVGVYEMVSISGTLVQNGYVTQLDESLYEYYRITLNTDGSAFVESKGRGVTTAVEAEGTWEWDDGQIKLKSRTLGISVVETMDWEDGVITYEAHQVGQGIEITMVLVLERVSIPEEDSRT